MKYSFKATPEDISDIVGTAISKTRIVIAIAKNTVGYCNMPVFKLFKMLLFVIDIIRVFFFI